MSQTLQREPLYVQLAKHYKRLIATGELAAGDQLPPIRDWGGIHGVSPGTAQKTIDLLAAEKLVTTAGRGGTIVSAEVSGPRLIFGPQERLGFAEPIPGERTEVSAAALENAPAYVAAILNLEEVPRHHLTPVYRREQKTWRPDGDGGWVPARLEVSWFHPRWVSIIPALASETEPIPSLGGVAWLIAQAASDPIVKGVHGTEARPALADGRERPFFGLGPGAVILAAVYKWKVLNPREELETIEYGEYVVPQGTVIEHEYDVRPALIGAGHAGGDL